MKQLLALTLLASFAFTSMVSAAPSPRTDFNWSALDLVAIQDRGRMKPLDTFALESLRFLTGRVRGKACGRSIVFLVGSSPSKRSGSTSHSSASITVR